MFKYIFLIWALVLGSIGQGAEPTKAQLTLKSFQEIIPSSGNLTLALTFTIPEGFHLNGPCMGIFCAPPQLNWVLPEGLSFETMEWPPQEKFTQGGIETQGYISEVTALARFKTSSLSFTNQTLHLNAQWTLCGETCFVEKGQFSIQFPTKSPLSLKEQAKIEESIKGISSPILWFMLFAFIGGMILNLMPCVLPVIALKVLDLIRVSQTPMKARISGGVYTMGVLVGFWVLALGFLIIKATTEANLGWGYQLQSAGFVLFLIALMGFMGLNLWGSFEFGSKLTTLGFTSQNPYLHAFGNGLLACVVATPCTAPFLGGAIGFGLSHGHIEALSIFTFMGLGLAFPLLILTLFPRLLGWMPPPGPWMVTLKKVFSLFMGATVLWLLWVLLGLVSVLLWGGLLLGLLIITGYVLLLDKSKSSPKMRLKLALGLFVAGVTSLLITFFIPFGSKDNAFVEFSFQKLAEARRAGKPVFLDFTARWCLTCQLNKIRVLQNQEILDLFKEKGVVLLRGDWTKYDPLITQALNVYARKSVPLNVFYPPQQDAEPIILPTILTVSNFEELLKK